MGIETISLANWYRHGASDSDDISDLYSEISEYFTQVSGVLLIGDLNIHHQRWLHFSNANTHIGSQLKTFCDFHGMHQLVHEPTRGEYLLDLVLTDVVGATVKILPSIADHKGVLVQLPMSAINEIEISRTVWDLKKANWQEIENEIVQFDWQLLGRGTAEDAVNLFLDVLWCVLVKHIPQKQIKNKRSTHPWLNSRCHAAILKKNQAEGTDRSEAAKSLCEEVLREERAKYVESLKAKLSTLSRRSKQ